MTTAAPVLEHVSSTRLTWLREVYAIADALRRTGRQRKLRDVTIALPLDQLAVEVIDLACLAISEGEFSESANDLEHFLEEIASDSFSKERFLSSLRGVARRAG